ncbi:MAG: NAD(P)H-dependent oxidoreductase [Methyloceanibacter sp.]|jgi:chromate reductase
MRLLFFAGSTREASYNKKLARLAQHIASANGIEGVFIDLRDYPMPLYEGDLEAEHGPPAKAVEFKALLGEYQGVFIACPEYNASITPLLKNTLDWVTRVRSKGENGLEVYRSRVFAISGASGGYYGAMRSLLQLRQVLEVGVGATVIPQQLALPRAGDAFDEDGSLKDEAQQHAVKRVVEALAIAARKFASP